MKVVPSMTEKIYTALTRYIDEYGWSWRLTCRPINCTFHAEYTEAQLKELYKKNCPPVDPLAGEATKEDCKPC